MGKIPEMEENFYLLLFSIEQKVLEDYSKLRLNLIDAIRVASLRGDKIAEIDLCRLDKKIEGRIASMLALQGEDLKTSVIVPKNEFTH